MTKTPAPAVVQEPPPKRKRGQQPFPERERHCAELIDWISNGGTMRAFCRQEGRPTYRTMYQWMEEDAEFDSQVARARDLGYDVIAEEAMHIADTPARGRRVKTVEDADGTSREVVEEDMTQHRKLQVETRLKLLACWNPKKYGQRQLVGSDPENPIVPPQVGEVFSEILKGLELERRLKAQKG